MLPNYVIQRTLKIRRGESQGTAFTIDRAGRQYLVTARHVVDGIVSGESIDLWHEGQWKPLGINVVGVGEGEIGPLISDLAQTRTRGWWRQQGVLLWAAGRGIRRCC